MSVYPLKVFKETWAHKGGTKEYHIIGIHSDANNRAVLIKRWGKKGAFGQIKVETGTADHISQAYGQIRSDKRSNGYDTGVTPFSLEAENLSGLIRAVTQPVWAKMGKSAIQFIDPDADTTGMREADAPEFDENGNRVPWRPRQVAVDTDALEKVKQAERMAEQETARAHKNFGLFN